MDISIKRYDKQDKPELLEMMKKLYESPAVLHKINEGYIANTVHMLDEGSEFTDAIILRVDNNVAGYVLLAYTYSNEVGGEVVWIEEVYLKEDYKGQKLSKSMINYILDEHRTAKRFRVEMVKTNNISMNLFSLFGFERFDYMQFVKDL